MNRAAILLKLWRKTMSNPKQKEIELALQVVALSDCGGTSKEKTQAVDKAWETLFLALTPAALVDGSVGESAGDSAQV